MWWIGSKSSIDAAEAAASAIVCARPEYHDGIEVPKDERTTERWAEPIALANSEWAIPALPGMAMPSGLRLAETLPSSGNLEP